MSTAAPGKLIVISGPSGAGKTTVVRRLFEECRLPLRLSISATTRKPRPGERDNVDYHFLPAEEFARLREADAFLECCEVFGKGSWYGTLRSEVEAGLASGAWVLLEIDVQGALQVLEKYPEAITIFLRPESMEELERRLRGRKTETEDKIQRRLADARHELEMKHRYQYDCINDTIEQSVAEICNLLDAEANVEAN